MTIPITNGNFSASGNEGSVGGGVLGGSGSGLINSGPWYGSYNGVAGLLAPPTIIIDDGRGTIGGLVSTNVAFVGILNNDAALYQNNIGSTFISGETYGFTVDVYTAGIIHNVSALTNTGTGIALRSDGSEVANTQTAPNALVDISILSSNHAQLYLEYTAQPDDDGENIGVELFVGQGSGLVNIAALGAVSFDNASLVIIPELSSASLMLLFGLVTLPCGYVRHRRKNRR
ncbi:hypothetical protein P3T73_05935 [Kiritimatiellota bacterium B12222]|nr:hypothetical protein P3T73_05935 [Kiritimatiellota bacterium B12222]